eukprot:scaffold1263_cov170-Ochromonas_danica.AAC.5
MDEIKKKYENTSKPEGEEGEASSTSADSSAPPSGGPSLFDKVIDVSKKGVNVFMENMKLSFDELLGKNKESLLSKDLKTADDAIKKKRDDQQQEGEEAVEEEPAGPSAIVLVKDGKNVWEQMKDRLQEAPFIKEVLKRSRHATKTAAETDLGKTVVNASKSVQDKISDAREFWETSQNPIVYALSGVVDTLTSQTEEAMALTAIKKLDPSYNKEDWAEEVRTVLVPKIIRAHLEGDIKVLKQWLGEAVYNKLAADIATRKHDGYAVNGNVLHVDENALIVQYLEEMGPVIVGIYMVQQINCVKNRKGEIVEGGETDIRAKYYSLAFQLKYDEDHHRLAWKVVDYQLAGDTPYL